MFLKCVIGVAVISIALKSVRSEDMAQNEVMDPNYGDGQMNYVKMDNINRNGALDSNGYAPQPPAETWLDTARNAFSGPAGQIVVHMAKEMISRSTGNSQVFSFTLLFFRIKGEAYLKKFEVKN